MCSDDTNADSSTRTRGDIAYDRAMKASSDLLVRIKEAGREMDVARSVMADVWSQAENTPFMTTVYQAVQEAKTGPDTARDARFIAIAMNGRGHRRS